MSHTLSPNVVPISKGETCTKELTAYMNGILSHTPESQVGDPLLAAIREKMNQIIGTFQVCYRAILAEEIRLMNLDAVADSLVETYEFVEAIDETVKKELCH